MERERLRALAERPNTTVLTPSHDAVRDPWKAEKLRVVVDRLVERVLSFPASESDFKIRKTCIEEDEEVLAFQRAHPRLYWILTDRSLLAKEEYRGVVSGMLDLRKQVEDGIVAEGEEADALATTRVVGACTSVPPPLPPEKKV